MANLFRCLIACLVIAFAPASHAVINPTSAYKWNITAAAGSRNFNGFTQGYIYDSGNAACAAIADARPGTSTTWQGWSRAQYVGGNSTSVNCTRYFYGWDWGEYNYLQGTANRSASPVQTCPSNSTLSGGTCVCNENFKEESGSCVPLPACPAANTTGGQRSVPTTYLSSPESLTTYDPAGCEAVIKCDTMVSYDNQTWCVGLSTWTGQRGTPGTLDSVASTQETQQIERFKEGECPGEINGVEVWVPCSSVTVPTTSGTSTAADGSTTTTSSKTTCTGDQCTTDTTTETKDAQGNVTGSTTASSTTGQATFCSSNPDHPSCKSSSFGGTCSAGFTCKGDAIQCEIAKVAWSQKCALEPSPGAGDGFNDAVSNPFSIGDITETFNVGSIDQSSAMGAGQCIQDKQIEVWGSSVTLPFSMICQYLAYMGTILQAVSLLIAARIVTRG